MRAVRIDEWGGPEVLKVVDDAPIPEPTENEALVCVSRAGINFADTHQRENSYIAKYELPFTPGGEVAGEIDGRRVVALMPSGGYAEYALAPVDRVFDIPDGVEDGEALALVLQGLTAWHLYRTIGRVGEGETVVVHAAAGGVGSLAVQLGPAMGAGRVIATASSAEKRELALELGADAALDPNSEDLEAELIEANGGERVDVVFEMAGGRVFEQSMEALAPFGRMVTYGIASREQNELKTGRLMRKSWTVAGFWFMHCLARPEEMMREPLRDLFERAARGEIRAVVGGTYPLSDVRRAHEDIAGRKTSGKLLLDPSA
ncbi:MAG: NADPH:quinone oxidoreductase family protein [Thermoleophilaceae bacterium]|nr:NADPH:quinone oxidoreductase family protein [Thermoleophilaceae bacterium]